ncbi:hypothetical protein, partial [Streptomyces sp. NPDC002530]
MGRGRPAPAQHGARSDDGRVRRPRAGPPPHGVNSNAGWATWIKDNFVKGDHPYYIATYFLLIV